MFSRVLNAVFLTVQKLFQGFCKWILLFFNWLLKVTDCTVDKYLDKINNNKSTQRTPKVDWSIVFILYKWMSELRGMCTARKMKFLIKDFFNKSDQVSCRFGHMYWKLPSWTTSLFVQWCFMNQFKIHNT